MDANGLLAALVAKGVPAKLVVNYTSADDPNHLLGRPSGYVSKVAFSDSRLAADTAYEKDALERGGSIEVFPNEAGARSRADYIQAIGAKSPALVNEYDYLDGPVLLRVTGLLTPAQAKTYAAAMEQALGAAAALITPSS